MEYIDQTGHRLILTGMPKRIISLVPSQTELLADLGLNKEVVGITKFCIHPASWRSEKTIVGGTKKLRMEVIDELNPDLIIANKEENTREEIEALREKYPVYISDIFDLHDASDMIFDIGLMTGKEIESRKLINTISSSFLSIHPSLEELSVAYLIWKGPYMAAASNTFIDEMIRTCGWINHFEDKERYPEVTIEELKGADLLLLSSEPYPFKQQHIDELQQQLPNAHIELVDGEMFSWYGSRLQYAPKYFNELIEKIHVSMTR
jgi:ABC-type Fe3+-hydroxamate transport system substrate-binding protein